VPVSLPDCEETNACDVAGAIVAQRGDVVTVVVPSVTPFTFVSRQLNSTQLSFIKKLTNATMGSA